VNLAARLDAVKARIAARIGNVSDEEIDDAAKRAKQHVRRRRHVATEAQGRALMVGACHPLQSASKQF
jgi:hypothetical protein